MAKIEITSKELENGVVQTKIFVDGHQLTGVRSFSLKQTTDCNIPILTVDLNAFDLSIDTPLAKVNQSGMGEIKSIEFENGIKSYGSKED